MRVPGHARTSSTHSSIERSNLPLDTHRKRPEGPAGPCEAPLSATSLVYSSYATHSAATEAFSLPTGVELVDAAATCDAAFSSCLH